MRQIPMLIVLVGMTVEAGFTQQAPTNTTAACSFADGKQISVRYDKEIAKGKEFPEGKAWTPGGQPMLLFTQAALSANNSEIPVGAYSMYIVRERDNWTLVVNKNVSAGSKYDKHQDLVRLSMLMGQLSEPQNMFTVAFGHTEPKQCNMRIYYGREGTWAEFQEK